MFLQESKVAVFSIRSPTKNSQKEHILERKWLEAVYSLYNFNLKTFLFIHLEKKKIWTKREKDCLGSEICFLGICNHLKTIQPTDKTHDHHHHRHPPVFDGTDKTVPMDLKDNSVTEQIEEINEGKV